MPPTDFVDPRIRFDVALKIDIDSFFDRASVKGASQF